MPAMITLKSVVTLLLGKQDAETLLKCDTMTRVFVIGREAGRVGTISRLTARLLLLKRVHALAAGIKIVPE